MRKRYSGMKQRGSAATSDAGTYDTMPLAELLYRYMWPFWLLRDASRGDRFVRAAAYRHNRRMRIYLPGYLFRWTLACGLSLWLSMGLESLSTPAPGLPDVFLVLAAAAGMLFTAGVCVIVVTAYLYLYLCRHPT